MIQAGCGRGRRRWKPPLKAVQKIAPALKLLMMQPGLHQAFLSRAMNG